MCWSTLLSVTSWNSISLISKLWRTTGIIFSQRSVMVRARFSRNCVNSFLDIFDLLKSNSCRPEWWQYFSAVIPHAMEGMWFSNEAMPHATLAFIQRIKDIPMVACSQDLFLSAIERPYEYAMQQRCKCEPNNEWRVYLTIGDGKPSVRLIFVDTGIDKETTRHHSKETKLPCLRHSTFSVMHIYGLQRY